MPPPAPFRPALLVIDMQNDFCPGDGDIPNGALAVPGGRDIIPTINHLLARPAFVYRVATRDWHPRDHISFAENHSGKKAFVDEVEIVHPEDLARDPGDPEDLAEDPKGLAKNSSHSTRRAYTTRLWPTHCVQHTLGADLVANLDTTKVDLVLDKGTDPRVEMYSAFYDPLRVEDSELARRLKEVRAGGEHGETAGGENGERARGEHRETAGGEHGETDGGEHGETARGEHGPENGKGEEEKGITHVYVVGLAYDYCVRASALDARAEGFDVILVRDATRAVDPSPDKLAALEEELESKGVKVRGLEDEEVRGWLG